MDKWPPLATLLQSGEFSDMKLNCEGTEFSLHKAIVCAHSPVLAAAFKGEFVVQKSHFDLTPTMLTVPISGSDNKYV
jgi:hypothetical protein